jgi:hypothetical protein
MHGVDSIPRALTHECLPRGRGWDKPFNDTYINYSRDGLPIYNRISDLVERIADVAEAAILREGGRKADVNGEPVFVLKPVD